jgi:hypothetical protein
MSRIRAVASGGLVLLGLLSTSCSNGDDGGTAGTGRGEIASAFEQDVQKLSADFLGNNSISGTKLDISSDGRTDLPCESGRVKRVYEASFLMLDRADGNGLLFAIVQTQP